MARRLFPIFLRLVVMALFAPLSASSALPALAHALSGPAEHVCTCSKGAHDTSCRVCNPTLGKDVTDVVDTTRGEIRGHCGTDEVAFGTVLPPAILGASLALVLPAGGRVVAPRADERLGPFVARAPPTPPPESPSV